MRCLTPSLIKQTDGFKQHVPCGHCTACWRNRQLAWALRIILEARSTEQSSFCTLTYSDLNRPGKLDYSHIQRFLKRLRWNTKGPVRFFCCGEYGKQSDREHWHLILFGIPPRELMGQLTKLWSQNGIELGRTHVGYVSPASARYVAKYSLKTGPNGADYVVQMSRRPGVGLDQIRQIGVWLCERYPVVEKLPTAWRIGGTMHPLDKSSRETLHSGYIGAGGRVTAPRSRLADDHETRVWSLLCDPQAMDMRQHLQLEQIEMRDHGTL